jgi:hypothetical protein
MSNKVEIDPRVVGRVPVRPLDVATNLVRVFRFPIDAGTVPTLVEETSSQPRIGILEMVSRETCKFVLPFKNKS